ncbi:unnamed protein product [Cylicostephanus goldi]|uniref:C2 domain-containing protein n=1 Tax=Cylicostephanus goldi TaxID=71465 RepID=A0A3P7LVQ0_CYLGO|nr:unnamed protein product [Cylicostephanus goldi]
MPLSAFQDYCSEKNNVFHEVRFLVFSWSTAAAVLYLPILEAVYQLQLLMQTLLRVGHAVFETQTKLSGGRSPVWNRTIHAYLPNGVESIYIQIFDEFSLQWMAQLSQSRTVSVSSHGLDAKKSGAWTTIVLPLYNLEK